MSKAKQRIRVPQEAKAAVEICAQEQEQKRVNELGDRERRGQEMLKRRQARAKESEEKRPLKDLRKEACSLGRQCLKMRKTQRGNGVRISSKGNQPPLYAFHFSIQLVLEAVGEAVDIGSAVGAGSPICPPL